MKHIKRITAFLLMVGVVTGAITLTYAFYPLEYTDTIRACADEMGVDRYLVASLIKAESNYDNLAVSSAEAKGVMQLTDETASFCAEKMGFELSEGDIYDPEVNIKLGVYYLKRMLTLFDNNPKLAIAAYNAGEGRVREWLNDPSYSSDGMTLDTIPYEETQNHVKKVDNYQKIYKVLYPNL